MKLTCVKCIFRFIFRSRQKRGKEKQNLIFNGKKQFGKGSFVYEVRRKSKVRALALPPIYKYPILV